MQMRGRGRRTVLCRRKRNRMDNKARLSVERTERKSNCAPICFFFSHTMDHLHIQNKGAMRSNRRMANTHDSTTSQTHSRTQSIHLILPPKNNFLVIYVNVAIKVFFNSIIIFIPLWNERLKKSAEKFWYFCFRKESCGRDPNFFIFFFLLEIGHSGKVPAKFSKLFLYNFF